jgi:hypothetical protein
VELTIDQQKALALAAARKRQAEAGGSAPTSGNTSIGFDPMSVDQSAMDAKPEYKPSSVPFLDPINAFGTALAENIPVIGKPLSDFGNQVDAAFASMVEGKPVSTEERANITQAEQDQFPAASVSGAIAGNVLPLAPLAATKVGQVAFGMTGGLPQRVAMGGLSGGAIAGADQAVRGGDMNQIKDSLMWGGAFGAAGGAAAPVVEDALFAAGRALGIIKPGQSVDSLSRPAREALIRTMQGNGALGPDGIAAIQAAGPRGMLVDASPAAADMLDTAFQRSGPGSVAAKNAVEARYTGASQDTTQALDQALGTPMNPVAASEKIRIGTKTARGDAYDAAYAQPIDYSAPEGMAIESLLNRVPQDAITAANKLMQLEGAQSAQIMAKIAPDGSVQFLRMPDVRQLDYITRGLNQVAKSGEGMGALGGQTDVGRAYGNLAQAIRGQMKKAAPEYATALQTAAHPIQLREAMQFGVDLLKPGALKVDIAGEIKAMTKPQLDMARQGARTYIDDVMAKLKAAMSDPSQDVREAQQALQMLLSRDARQKLGLLLGPGKANQLYAQLRTAAKSFNLKASTATNSRTYGRQAVDQAIQQTIDGNAFTALMRGEPLQAGKRTIQAVTGMDNAGVTNMKDKVFSEIANTLTLQGPKAEDMLTQLARRLGYPKPNAPLLAGFAQASSDAAPPVFDRP